MNQVAIIETDAVVASMSRAHNQSLTKRMEAAAARVNLRAAA